MTLVELSETGRRAAETRSQLESRMPVTLHDGRAYLRPILRSLQDGAVVMSACDATGGGEELGRRCVRSVLGQPMPLPVGPIWLALRSGAPLLTVCCHRNPRAIPGRDPVYVGEIGPEIPLRRDLGTRQGLEDGVDRIAEYLNEVLGAWPGDWLFWDGFQPGGLLADPTSEAT